MVDDVLQSLLGVTLFVEDAYKLILRNIVDALHDETLTPERRLMEGVHDIDEQSPSAPVR